MDAAEVSSAHHCFIFHAISLLFLVVVSVDVDEAVIPLSDGDTSEVNSGVSIVPCGIRNARGERCPPQYSSIFRVRGNEDTSKDCPQQQ